MKKAQLSAGEIEISEEADNAHSALLLAFLEVTGKRGYQALKNQGYDFSEYKGLDEAFK